MFESISASFQKVGIMGSHWFTQCFITICILFLSGFKIIVTVYGCDLDFLVWLHGSSSYATPSALLSAIYDIFSQSPTHS